MTSDIQVRHFFFEHGEQLKLASRLNYFSMIFNEFSFDISKKVKENTLKWIWIPHALKMHIWKYIYPQNKVLYSVWWAINFSKDFQRNRMGLSSWSLSHNRNKKGSVLIGLPGHSTEVCIQILQKIPIYPKRSSKLGIPETIIWNPKIPKWTGLTSESVGGV